MSNDLFFKLFATVANLLFIIWLVFTDPKQNHMGKKWLWGGKFSIIMLIFNEDGSFKKYAKLVMGIMALVNLLILWFDIL